MAEEAHVSDEGAATGADEGAKFTQDDVNRMVGVARQEARTAFLKKFGFDSEDAVKTALTEAEQLRQATMTESEKMAAELATLKAEKEAAIEAAKQAELTNLRASIARSKGLPEPLIKAISGTDEEAITAEVEELLPLISQQSAPEDLGSGTNPPGAGSNLSPDEQMANLLASTLTRGKVR
jgi:proline dehydrogenase